MVEIAITIGVFYVLPAFILLIITLWLRENPFRHDNAEIIFFPIVNMCAFMTIIVSVTLDFIDTCHNFIDKAFRGR